MNNFVIGLKKFFTNKNVVTVLGVLVVLVILFFGYTGSIKKETSPINVPVAAKTINAETQITSEDVTYTQVAGRMVGEGVVTASANIIGKHTGEKKETLRPANIPLGIMGRNEYTRDVDAFNGIMPGPIHTDALVDMPWFIDEEKAEGNPWGSVYGAIKPGDLIKSDLNGRMMKSPLSDKDAVAKMSIAEYEAERQQVVGTVYSTDKSLLPEGAARFAQ